MIYNEGANQQTLAKIKQVMGRNSNEFVATTYISRGSVDSIPKPFPLFPIH